MVNVRYAVILVNGVMENPERIRSWVVNAGLCIAADGGFSHGARLGITPDVLIGDLDSVTAADVNDVEKNGGAVIRYPVDKNETDLELAVNYAVEAGFRNIILIGAGGGRTDQFLANLYLLSNPKWADFRIKMVDDKEEIFLIRKQGKIYGTSGDTVSLIPISEVVCGVTTTNLKYPLNREDLYRYKTRGISNRMITDFAEVSIQSGLLYCAHSLNYKKIEEENKGVRL